MVALVRSPQLPKNTLVSPDYLAGDNWRSDDSLNLPLKNSFNGQESALEVLQFLTEANQRSTIPGGMLWAFIKGHVYVLMQERQRLVTEIQAAITRGLIIASASAHDGEFDLKINEGINSSPIAV